MVLKILVRQLAKMLNKFESDRLILRSWNSSDVEPFLAMNQDDRVVEFLAGKMTKAQVEDFIFQANDHIEKYGFGLWALELKENGKLIGFTGLKYQDFAASFLPAFEIGWRLAFEYWGKGLAFEAAQKNLAIAFDEFKLDHLVSFTAVKNLRSQKLMQKIGMKRDLNGDFLHPKLAKNHHLSKHVLYRIARQDYLKS